MKNDIHLFAQRIEHKLGRKLNGEALVKLWHVLRGKEKPSKKTLDKLALFAGFQTWDDFHEALHGEDDGLIDEI